MIIGVCDGYTISSEVYRISLLHLNTVTTLKPIPTKMCTDVTACTSGSTVYITGIGKAPYKQVWRRDIVSDWIRCADIPIGLRRYCITVVDSSLYVLGGWVEAEKLVSRNVLCYNTKTNKWTQDGELIQQVQSAACVSYKNLIYIFGGSSSGGIKMTSIQEYDPAQRTCNLLDSSLPYTHWMRPVLWETSVILIGGVTCLVYNFETGIWQERKQYRTQVENCALALENGTIYVAGGADISKSEDSEEWNMSWTAEIRSVSVMDIMKDKPLDWKWHGKLPKFAMFHAYSSTLLPV